MLVGFSFFGDPFAASGGWTEENEIGRLWSRFGAYLEQHSGEIRHARDINIGYEVHIEHPDTPLKGHYEVFVGIEVAQLEDVPPALLVKMLPPAQYATLALSGEQITMDWSKQIYSEWLPAAGYQAARGYMFERYDERFKGLDNLEESVMEIFIPVQRSAGAV